MDIIIEIDDLLKSIKESIEELEQVGRNIAKLDMDYQKVYSEEVLKIMLFGVKYESGQSLGPLPGSTAKEVAKGSKKVLEVKYKLDGEKITQEIIKESIYLKKRKLRVKENDLEAIRRGR